MIDLFFNIIFFIIVFIVAAIAIMWLFIILKKTIDIIKDEINEMVEEHKEKKEDESYCINQFKKYICKVIEYNGFHIDNEPDCISFGQGEYVIEVRISLEVCDDMKEKFDKMQDEFCNKGYGSYYGETKVDKGILHTCITLITGERFKHRIWSNKE